MRKTGFSKTMLSIILFLSFLSIKAQSQPEINAQQQVMRMEKGVELSEPEKRELYNLAIDFENQKQSIRKKNKGNNGLIQEESKSLNTEYNRRIKEIIGDKKYKVWTKYKKENPNYKL